MGSPGALAVGSRGDSTQRASGSEACPRPPASATRAESTRSWGNGSSWTSRRTTRSSREACACAAVRYRLTTTPMFVHCCHCLDCQRQTGSAFVIYALIETARLQIEGAEPERFEMPTDSGRAHGIYSCQSCGIAVWSEYGGLGTWVRARGNARRPAAPGARRAHLRAVEVPWVTLPEGVPAFEGYYDALKLWPPESLARRSTVLAGT